MCDGLPRLLDAGDVIAVEKADSDQEYGEYGSDEQPAPRTLGRAIVKNGTGREVSSGNRRLRMPRLAKPPGCEQYR